MLKNSSLGFIGFLQATGLLTYCSLIGLLMSKGNHIFGKVPNLFGPTAFLIIFVVSAVITALTYLGYPFILFWERKQPQKAIRLVIWTTIWAVIYIAIILTCFLLLNRSII